MQQSSIGMTGELETSKGALKFYFDLLKWKLRMQ